ncbi:MAG: molybdenum cofactor guanylyltransferase [Acidimicrobiales bacterium]
MNSESPPSFVGAVLAGGSSTRMGRDKALVEVDGDPLVRRVASALARAGATRVFVVGGDRPEIEALGLEVVADRFPGEGPLGGVLTAMSATESAVIAILATDIVAPDPTTIRAVLDALAGDDVAVPVSGGRRHFHHAVWGRSAQQPLESSFASGERAIKRAARDLAVVEVAGLPAGALADADTPDELPYTQGSPRGGR